MMRSMYSGITGLQGFQIAMDIVGNNIANVNTVGFKASRVTFQTTLLQTIKASKSPQENLGGTNPIQVGLGTKLASVDKIMSQGSFQNTGKKTDLAIQGDGFFVLSDGVGTYYTRAGNFALDSAGYLVNPATGFKLQGWSAKLTTSGKRVVDPNEPIGDIKIQAGLVMAAKQTSNIKLAHNLNSTVGLKETTITIQTNAGDQVPVRFIFERDMSLENRSRNVYRWYAEVLGTDNYELDAGSMTGTVELDDFGNVIQWTFDPGHTVVDNSGVRVDIGNTSTTWTIRATGNVVMLSSGSPVSVNALRLFRDLANPDNVIIVADVDGDFATTADQYTFTISTNGTLDDLNRQLKAGVKSGTDEIKGLHIFLGEGRTFTDIPVTDTATPTYFEISLNTTRNDSILLYDTKGMLAPETETSLLLDSDGNFTTTGDQEKVEFTGSLILTGPSGETVYYDPRRVIFNFDAASKTGSITLYLRDGTSISFDLLNDTDGDGISDAPISKEVFNRLLNEGLSNELGYTISGLQISNGSSTDILGFATGTSATYISTVATIQPPVQGTPRFTEIDNPQNFVVADYESPSVTTSVIVYDSLGNPTNVYLKLTKIAENTWFWKAETSDGKPLYSLMSDGTMSDEPAEGVIAFDSNGALAARSWTLDESGNILYNIAESYPVGFWYDPAREGAALDIDVYPSSTAAAGPVKVEISFNEVTQFAAPNSVAVVEQDGNAEGTLESFAINESGEIIGTFSNGLTDILGQVALAVFNNPAGLTEIGNSMFVQSANSGLPQIGEAGVGGRGTLIPGALEMSNVDLAEEFTKMIVAQRGFQAVARVITTADDILRELVSIKR